MSTLSRASAAVSKGTDERTHPWHPIGTPWHSIALLAAAALLAWPLAGVLQYDRGRVAVGEVWRLATCQWTHWSVDHLLWDVLVFVALGVACAARGRAVTLATIALAAVAVPVAVHVACPAIDTFRGLSGVDSALFGLLMTRVALDARRRREAAVAVLAGVGFAAKIAYESATGAAIFADGTFTVVPLAHAVGFAVGVVAAVVTQLKKAGRA